MLTKKVTAAKTVKPSAKKLAAKTSSKMKSASSSKTLKPTVAKKVVKKTRVAKESPQVTPVKEKMNRSQQNASYVEAALAVQLPGSVELTERQAKLLVAAVLEKQSELILGSLSPKGIGEFVMPGIAKFLTRKIPARKVPAREAGEVKSPLTGKIVQQEARAAFTKPATVRVKIRPLKIVKDVAIPAVKK